jgi:hypothetical protein
MPAEATAISVGTWRQEWRAGRSRAIKASGAAAVPVTLVLGAQDQPPTASPHRRATVKPAQVMEPGGKPTGTGTRATAEGHEPQTAGRRETRVGRRKQGNQRTAGEGTNLAGRRETGGKPAGTPEAVRSGPKPPGESPGIWGRTHPPRRWRSPGGVGRWARLIPAHLVLPQPAGPPVPAAGWPGLRRVLWISISPPHREAGHICRRGGTPT